MSSLLRKGCGTVQESAVWVCIRSVEDGERSGFRECCVCVSLLINRCGTV